MKHDNDNAHCCLLPSSMRECVCVCTWRVRRLSIHCVGQSTITLPLPSRPTLARMNMPAYITDWCWLPPEEIRDEEEQHNTEMRADNERAITSSRHKKSLIVALLLGFAYERRGSAEQRIEIRISFTKFLYFLCQLFRCLRNSPSVVAANEAAIAIIELK